MAKPIAVVAIWALIATLGATIVTIGMEKASATQYLELTKMLLSWKVISGGLALGAGVTFKTQIGDALKNLGGY